VDTTKTITHLSLCSGYSGIGLGLKRVLPGLREIAHVEIEAFAVANLVSKMESEQIYAAPIYTDVKTFPYKEFCGRVDILSGGFPCQPFSSAGNRQGVEDPRHLYPYISRGIRECKPRIVFLENVEGIISSKTADGESVLKYVLSDLEEMGYRATAGIFSASEVGAPHQRKRVFILGYSKHEGLQGHNEHSSSEYREDEGPIVGAGSGCGTPEELGYSDNRRCSLSKQPRSSSEEISGGKINIEPSNGSTELGNSQHNGHTTCTESREVSGSQEERRMQESEGGSNEIPNTDSQGLEGLRECNNSKRWQTPDGQPRSYCEVWPARPNEQQHEWEEPRTKPKLGRTANGTTSRVDRLRLLGNGVVPLTAARAFKVLIGRVID
jgi:DNA (cytosine-5)-methyltransferase 1